MFLYNLIIIKEYMTAYKDIDEEYQKEAIKEKELQLKKVYLLEESTPKKLAQQITERRLNWFKENKSSLYSKYFLNGNHMKLEEIAFRIIYFDYMNIKENRIQLIDLNKSGLKILCYNFCPYLLAWQNLTKEKQINVDIRDICKNIVEPGINNLLEAICKDIFAKQDSRKLNNPYLNFSRDYTQIRPYSNCCVEFIKPKTE